MSIIIKIRWNIRVLALILARLKKNAHRACMPKLQKKAVMAIGAGEAELHRAFCGVFSSPESILAWIYTLRRQGSTSTKALSIYFYWNIGFQRIRRWQCVVCVRLLALSVPLSLRTTRKWWSYRHHLVHSWDRNILSRQYKFMKGLY